MPTFLNVLQEARVSVIEEVEAHGLEDVVGSISIEIGKMWINKFIAALEQQHSGICGAFLLTGKLYTSKGGEFVISLPDDMEDTPDPTEIPVIGKVGEYRTLIFWKDN
jgi:hypothetical protein